NFARRRLQRAGTSSRWVRSPAAPKITRTHGSPGRACGSISRARLWSGFGLDMSAEFVAHGREQLVGEARRLARSEAGVERSREDIRRHRFLDRRHDGPAALAGIIDKSGIARELRIFRQRHGGE